MVLSSYSLVLYGVPRPGGHQGADYISTPGQDVKAIGDGTVLRLPDGGIVIDGTVDGTSYKILYMDVDASLKVGSTVQAGQTLGTAQDITTRYAGITNHVHVKLRIDGNVVDPAKYIPGD